MSMNASAHTIHRQTVELVVADARDAQRVRQRADQLCRQQLIPLLERVLGSVAGGDDVLEIDRLVVGLAISSADRFAAEFLPGVEDALNRALRRISDSVAADFSAGGGRMPFSDAASAFDGSAGGANVPAGASGPGRDAGPASRSASRPTARGKSSAASRSELLVYFLDTGRLPWWAPPDAAASLDALLVASLQDVAAESSAIARTLIDRPHRRARLARQFGSDALHALTGVLVQVPRSTSRAVIEGVLPGIAAADRHGSVPRFWEFLLDHLFRAGATVGQARFERVVARAVGAATLPPGAGDNMLAAALPERRTAASTHGRDRPVPPMTEPAVSQTPAEMREGGKETAAPESGDPAEALPTADASLRADSPGGGAADGGAREVPVDRPETAGGVRLSDRRSDSPAAMVSLDHATPVHNAGMVLVWPFLGRFFASLGLTTDNGFIDPAAAERGVHLLHHLTDGTRRAIEPRLLLNKVLCGLPIDRPVVRELPLAPGERRACRELLQAVIGHWTALQNTSVAGLQQSFLQRFGLLSQADGRFHLHVDRTAYDMLLDRLPWGIAVVKLSWMKQPLMVEW